MAFSRYDQPGLTGSWFVMFLVVSRKNGGCMRLCIQPLAVSLSLLMSAPVFAARVSFEPSLELKETYTSNVSFTTPGKDDLITEVNPGLALQADGSRLNANVRYTLQNLFYANDSRRNARFHNLGADASAELIRDFAFLNLKASDTQRVTLPSRGIARDNLNIVNRTHVFAQTFNPYFKKRFGRTAEGSASYSYETRTYSKGASNAEIKAVNVGLDSGPSFQRMFWSLSYSKKTVKRKEASNYSKGSSIGKGGYQLSKKLSVLFRAGNTQNDLAAAQGRGGQNGSYYAAGIRLIPHSTLTIDLLSGRRLDLASLSWMPSPRSALDIVWRDKKVGLNPGEVMQGSMRLINRRITWRGSYLEDTTSTQGSQSLGGGGSRQGQSGNLSTSAFPFSNALFRRKRAQTSFGYKTAKSLVSLELHKEHRKFDNNGNIQESYGGTVSWRWRFAARTVMLLSYLDSRSKYSDDNGDEFDGKLRSMDVSFSRKIGRGMEGTVTARSMTRDGLAGRRSFDENRLGIGVKWRF